MLGDGHPQKELGSDRGSPCSPSTSTATADQHLSRALRRPPQPRRRERADAYDSPARWRNGDGLIDSRDAVFARLQLWTDSNQDASRTGELDPDPGVLSLNLSAAPRSSSTRQVL